MTTGLRLRADDAERRAERAYHRLREVHGGEQIERTYEKRVSRDRIRTLVERILASGAPYGAHTLVYREDGGVLLVRDGGVDMWVLPGGGVDGEETLREAAERELLEEAGVAATYEGLAMLTRVEVACGPHETWGVLPVFGASADGTEPTVADPDGEIRDARWFAPESIPADTRDRADVIAAARALA